MGNLAIKIYPFLLLVLVRVHPLELAALLLSLYLIMLTSRTTDDLTPPDALKAKV
jgi:hypothetical protein